MSLARLAMVSLMAVMGIGVYIYWTFFVSGNAVPNKDFEVVYDDGEIRKVTIYTPEGRKYLGLCSGCETPEEYRNWQVYAGGGRTFRAPETAIFVNCNVIDCSDYNKSIFSGISSKYPQSTDPRYQEVKNLVYQRLGMTWIQCEGVDEKRDPWAIWTTPPKAEDFMPDEEPTCYYVHPNGTRTIAE